MVLKLRNPEKEEKTQTFKMQNSILKINSNPQFDNSITQVEIHGHNPYANSSLKNNDEIRIVIQQQDLCVLQAKVFSTSKEEFTN